MGMGLAEVRGKLRSGFNGILEEGVPLADYTTYRIGGPAGLLAIPKGTEDLACLLEAVIASEARLLVLGRGSNTLVSDRGFEGVVAVLSRGLGRITRKGEDEVYVESGCDLNSLVKWTIELGMAGLEELSGIPGSVGGAVRMNAGAMGSEIGQKIESVEVMRLCGDRVERKCVKRGEIGFAYRGTDLDDRDVIYGARLKLARESKKALEARRKEVLRWRRKNQPLKQPSAGSVFRNPPGISAGELIERCGCKGMRVGEAMVSEKHANFIVNLGGARAGDVYALIERVKAEISRREGIELVEEIRIIGEMGEEGG
ncbi:MAG: UDP-N-acetylmuramate dehydrogenase [Actinobacteria bacterium]|jgi:UDP-N-acetylmuramate dehydrogenase|nr:MAG: UDP-N-acetylmuramate dehydrogenase [Actinomycetota bacterium]